VEVQIIQVPFDSAHRSLRMGCGPEHFLDEGLVGLLQQRGHAVDVYCVEPDSAFPAEVKTAFELHRLLAKQVKASSAEGKFPLVLSGNCNSSLGTIAGVGSSDLGIIWFDGHGDFNTPETSVSGFLDGMGLATAVGLCWKKLVASIPGFQPIAGARVIHVGLREFSDDEHDLFKQSGVAVIDAKLIRRIGVWNAIEPALDMLRGSVERVYLHFDLDVLDPALAPANEFALPDGLTLEHVLEAVGLIGSHFKVCACGIASYDPAFDQQGKVFQAGLKIIETTLKEASKQCKDSQEILRQATQTGTA
jgi:arginase